MMSRSSAQLKKLANGGENPIGHIGAVLIHDSFQQVDNLAPSDGFYLSSPPSGNNISVKDSLGLSPTPSLWFRILLDELPGDSGDCIGKTFSSPSGSNIHGVYPLGGLPHCLACFLSSLSERECCIGPNGESALPATDAIEHNPTLVPTACDAQSEAWESCVEMVFLSLLRWPDSLDRRCGKGGL